MSKSEELFVFRVEIEGELEPLYLYAAFKAAALQKARRLSRMLFLHDNIGLISRQLTPLNDSVLIAEQMCVLLGEEIPPRKEHLTAEKFWDKLAQELEVLSHAL